MLKYSRQRECIKQNLASRCDHPTAEMVFSDIKKVYPNVSLGTVYRNLTLLADLGEIRKVSDGIGPDRFDGNTTEHCHFTCTRCGKMVDITLKDQEKLNQEASDIYPGKILSNSIHFFGICPECLSDTRNQEKTE